MILLFFDGPGSDQRVLKNNVFFDFWKRHLKHYKKSVIRAIGENHFFDAFLG